MQIATINIIGKKLNKGVDKASFLYYNKGTKNKGVVTMKTYICDYALASFYTIDYVIRRAFPMAQVVCSDLLDEDRFEARVYFVDDLDMLDDIMAEFEFVGWED
jgi:hypothetical protein